MGLIGEFIELWLYYPLSFFYKFLIISLIPWAWTINACLSLLAPVLTIMLAITAGFKIVLWAGALAYLLAFISFKGFSKE